PSSGTAEPIMPAEQYAQSMDFDALPEQKIFENDVNSPIPVKITFSQKDEAAPEYNGGITAREIFERLEFESRRYPQINREEL
ncbi:MAG TPA: hypothetical protein DCP97_00425, partial [Ruminococcaceae bacterium]|nr:hypothetical protein [Oscillospiraceae bacterium]